MAGACLLVAAPGRPVMAAGEACYELTMRDLLPGGRDVVLMVRVDGGQVREHAAAVAGQPNVECRVKEHGLKLAGRRLSGPMRIAVGGRIEKVDLDASLLKLTDFTPPRAVRGPGARVSHGCA